MAGRSTIYAVAERAGVSTATVSRTLRESHKVAPGTRDRVLAAAAELRYLPTAAARQLASRRDAALGLVLPHIAGQYYADLVVGFEEEAGRLGYSVSLVLANPRADASRAVWELAERVEGLAFMARSSVDDTQVAQLAGSRVVVTGARAQVGEVPAVSVAGREVARELTEHLLASGRRRVRFAGAVEPGSDLAERYAGYAEAHLARALAVPDPLSCPLEEAGGAEVAQRLLSRDVRADALLCGNDLIALACGRTLAEAGWRIPEDLALTGWDDLLTARYVTPSLTTVRQPTTELAKTAVRAMHAAITGSIPADTSAEEIVLRSEPVYRRSCCTDPHPTRERFRP